MKLGLTRTETGEQREYELLLAVAMRRGYLMLCGALALVCAGELLFFLAGTSAELWSEATWQMWTRIGVTGLCIVIAGGSVLLRKQLQTTRNITSAATALIVGIVTLLICVRFPLEPALPTYGAWGLLDVLMLHIAVTLVLPWKPWESIQPFVVPMALWAALLLAFTPALDPMTRTVIIICSPVALLPGGLIAWWRTKRALEQFNQQMLGRKVRSLGGELSRARIVHDAMFPVPFDFGHVEFQYEYAPIQEIGGDYVHVHHCPRTGRITLTILDVAGHGLAAALTVNRLFGELERIRAENPDAEPGEVMELLNRYIHLTMSNHSMFATGACMMLDPSSGALKWVNAGHPPAFIRHGDGRVDDLGGTCMLLGVESYDEFDANMKSTTMRPGDVLIAYTDGAIEARNKQGRQLGIEQLRETTRFDPPPRNWSRFLATAVARHHEGNCDDDILIVSLTLRGLHVVPRSTKPGAAAAPVTHSPA